MGNLKQASGEIQAQVLPKFFQDNPLLCSFSLQLIFISEQPFYGNYLTLHSHTNTVISHVFAYSSIAPMLVDGKQKIAHQLALFVHQHLFITPLLIVSPGDAGKPPINLLCSFANLGRRPFLFFIQSFCRIYCVIRVNRSRSEKYCALIPATTW